MTSVTEAPIRVVIVDDHPMVREGLRTMLDDEGIEVVGEAGTTAEALREARRAAPDVLLLDVELADGDGLATLPELKRTVPGAVSCFRPCAPSGPGSP